jgi:hypothetical protein
MPAFRVIPNAQNAHMDSQWTKLGARLALA